MTTSHTHDYPLSQTLDLAQRVVNVLSSFSKECLEEWGQNYPDSIDATINECRQQIVTHPEYSNASNIKKKKADDIFQQQLKLIGKYVDPVLLGDLIKEFSMQGDIKFLTLLIEILSDEGKMIVGPQALGDVIRSIFYETQFGTAEKQEEAVSALSQIMQSLANHPHADIVHLVDPYMLGITLVDASRFGQLDVVKTILDNLSDDAMVILGAQKIGQVIEGIYHAPSYAANVTNEETVTLIQGTMKRLTRHPYMAISGLVDVSTLHNVVKAAFADNNIAVVNAITESLSGGSKVINNTINEEHVSHKGTSNYMKKKIETQHPEEINTLKIFLMREFAPHKNYGLAAYV